ncbi:MAG: response regulator [Synergistaceae bacterium]|jgi:PAS domain S-box-containing protein|nr:response regulator [Synergistaceae bacterium]
MKKSLITLFSILASLALSAIVCAAPERSGFSYDAVLDDYKKIPGVTSNDVDAVEKLRESVSGFTYGVLRSGEAFERLDGSEGGFSAEFCRMLSRMFGIRFEMKFYDGPDQLALALESGEADFTGEFAPGGGYFTTGAICERTLKVFRNRRAPDVINASNERELLFAFIEGSEADSLAGAMFEDAEKIYAGNYPTIARMLQTGRIDAFFDMSPSVYNFETYSFIAAEDHFPLLYRPAAMATANRARRPIIGVVEKFLESGGIYYLSQLYSDGDRDFMRHKFNVSLSDEERAYIAALSETGSSVMVAAESDYYPISFYNAKDEEFQGIALDVLKEIADISGIEFVVANAPGTSMMELMDNLEGVGVSMITGLSFVRERDGAFLWSADPFTFDQCALLSVATYPDVDISQVRYHTVGLIKGSPHSEIFNEWFPGSTNIIWYNAAEDAFGALERGDVDLVMSSRNHLLSLTNYSERPGFKTSIVFNHNMYSRFGFNQNEGFLRSIIGKAQLLTPTETISDRWLRKVFDYRGKLMRDIFPFLMAFLCALALSIVALFLMNLKNKRLGKDLEKLVKIRTHELEIQTATLTTVFSTIPDLIFCKDMEGRYTQCNRSLERYLNLGRDEIIGKTDASVFGGVDSDEHSAEYMPEDTGVAKVIEEEIYSPYLGQKRLFETIKTPLVQGDRVTGIMGIARDITERKAIEAAARVASQAKSDFLARVSHEIRTPLNAIIGMTRIAKNSIADTEKALSSIDEISTASSHLLGIVNDVLDMSKIESGKFEISKEPFSLIASLSEVSSIVSQRCREKFITFESNLGELPDAYLMGDKMRLNQVLINLLGNAVKFTPKDGSVSFMTNVLEDSPEGMRLAFVLSDTGIGMSEEQMKRLFVAFEQADSSIATRFGGTGLGLAISQNLVNLMGSVITVKSGVGAGSTFRFELFFQRASETPRAGRDEPVKNLDLTGKRILLAEDIDINRLILRELLSETNVEIDEAADGQQAVEAFERWEEGHYGLIFMDVQMPLMDGYEATKAIRALPRSDARTVPIIAMTANAYQEDVNKALAVGMNGHLSKPINIEMVMRTLSAILKK